MRSPSRLIPRISAACVRLPVVSRRTAKISFFSISAKATTKSGLRVKALLDTREYEPGEKITDDEIRMLRMKPHRFHGDWNYTFQPRHEA